MILKRNSRIKLVLFFLFFIFTVSHAWSQGFLHVHGQEIVDGKGENVILRGIGTGNWMLQEGYMMKTSGVANTQHEFRQKLIETIGVERTQLFYEEWLHSHFTKTDVDSMKTWGFNSIRVALHYLWFTPPIEEEPLAGEITWLNKGFELTDSLLAWCSQNEMYLILDLHGAPGGQGKDAAISDYDPSKPSLWESEENKAKTVALWKKLAQRYSNEPWIGGYDLINEINWTFNDNNAQIRELYGQITDAIREVDPNHIIFIEGNWFANDFTGLTPAWDANMVYSFHKYWTYNNADALSWVTNLRQQTNRPIWLGETGENSNTWFTNLVHLSESNNIGWSWWPVKKSGINNILKVKTNDDYLQLIEMWKGNGSMSANAAFQAVMTFARNHRFENCEIAYDVIDALIRQPHTTQTRPFKAHHTGEIIFASDYDLGRNNFAYFDHDTANYHLNTDAFGTWNTGWAYRNDGVDIEAVRNEEISNGYIVGWTAKGEWLQYTIDVEAEAAFRFSIRTAGEGGGKVHLEANGREISGSIALPATGAWDQWQTSTVDELILPEGTTQIRLKVDEAGSNINYFSFTQPSPVEEVAFKLLSAKTDPLANVIFLNLNKAVSTSSEDIIASDFQVIVNSSLASVKQLWITEDNPQQIAIEVDQYLFHTDNIRLSYQGTSVHSPDQQLENFSAEKVLNQLLPHHRIPGKIEAEDFLTNNGFELENCTDIGGGLNTAYASDGDYLDYLVYVEEERNYLVEFRVAAKEGSPELLIMNEKDGRMMANELLRINATGDWQNWLTQAIKIELPAGKYRLRLLSRKGEHNLNWINFTYTSSQEAINKDETFSVFPNPASDSLWIATAIGKQKTVLVFDMQGKKVTSFKTADQHIFIDTSDYPPGIYLLSISNGSNSSSKKIQISK